MNNPIQEKQKRKPTDVRKREIIAAAICIIARDGARAFTAKNVATAVGITSGAIFRHFASMDAIVGDAVESIEDILSCDFPTGIDEPIERLKNFFLNRTRTILAYPNISRLLFSDHLEQAAGFAAARRLSQAKSRSRKFVHECLGAADRAGSLGAGVDVEVATILVIGAIFSMSHRSTRVVNQPKSPELSNGVWLMLEHMLTTSPQMANQRRIVS